MKLFFLFCHMMRSVLLGCLLYGNAATSAADEISSLTLTTDPSLKAELPNLNGFYIKASYFDSDCKQFKSATGTLLNYCSALSMTTATQTSMTKTMYSDGNCKQISSQQTYPYTSSCGGFGNLDIVSPTYLPPWDFDFITQR